MDDRYMGQRKPVGLRCWVLEESERMKTNLLNKVSKTCEHRVLFQTKSREPCIACWLDLENIHCFGSQDTWSRDCSQTVTRWTKRVVGAGGRCGWKEGGGRSCAGFISSLWVSLRPRSQNINHKSKKPQFPTRKGETQKSHSTRPLSQTSTTLDLGQKDRELKC